MGGVGKLALGAVTAIGRSGARVRVPSAVREGVLALQRDRAAHPAWTGEHTGAALEAERVKDFQEKHRGAAAGLESMRHLFRKQPKPKPAGAASG